MRREQRVREAGVGGSNPLTPNKEINTSAGVLHLQVPAASDQIRAGSAYSHASNLARKSPAGANPAVCGGDSRLGE